MSWTRLLVANRGEIAVRVVRAAQALSITAIAIYSEADADALHVQLADEAELIGPAPASASYLNSDAILAAADRADAEAIHPGYGFLSEDAGFAQTVEDAGLVFVGPSASTIAAMGNKVEARRIAEKNGIPIVPGASVGSRELHELLEFGFPLMIKSAGGGGGKGIRVVEHPDDLAALLTDAAREAEAAFGDGTLYVERFLPHARHIEVQVLGDGVSFVHLGERDCSVQRRKQKLLEEAPAPTLRPDTRSKLCADAVRLMKAVHYRGAGTVEFLYDERSDEYFFIETNTRIQVEHPITEVTTGVDLVAEQIRIALGEGLRFRQEDIRHTGAAIEVRINAEDGLNGFMPSPGIISRFQPPLGPWTRIDTYIQDGAVIPPYYDSLIGKLIVWGDDRDSAIARLACALAETVIDGVATTVPMFRELIADGSFLRAEYSTTWFEEWLDNDRRS